jgi:hypothetical protein
MQSSLLIQSSRGIELLGYPGRQSDREHYAIPHEFDGISLRQNGHPVAIERWYWQ